MAGTTIDELVIQIALDASGLKKGQQEVEGRLKTIKEKMEDTGKQAETSGKRMSAFFDGARNSALALVAALTGTAGLVKALADAAKGLVDFGQAASSIGIGQSTLSAIELAVTRAGGNADAIRAALVAGAKRQQAMKLGGQDTDYAQFLQGIGGTLDDTQAVILEKLAKFADDNRAKGQAFFNNWAEKGGYGAFEQEGWKGLTQYRADIQHEQPFVITPDQVKAAQEFYGAWRDLIAAWDTANRKFAAEIEPWLGPLLEHMTAFAKDNPQVVVGIEGITAALTSMALVRFVGLITGLNGVADGITSITLALTRLGGLPAALLALIGLGAKAQLTAGETDAEMIKRGFAPSGALDDYGHPQEWRNPATGETVPAIDAGDYIRAHGGAVAAPMSGANADKAIAFFKAKGYTDEQIAGIMGNLQTESGFNPLVPENAFNKGHRGIAQWDATRQAAFKAMFGHDINDPSIPASQLLNEQLQFIDAELHGTHKAALDAMQGQSAEGSADAFNRLYEISGQSSAGRQGTAANWFRRLHAPPPPPKPQSYLLNPMHGAGTQTANNDNSFTHNGDIIVHTTANNGKDIAADIKRAMRDQMMNEQADRGIA